MKERWWVKGVSEDKELGNGMQLEPRRVAEAEVRIITVEADGKLMIKA